MNRVIQKIQKDSDFRIKVIIVAGTIFLWLLMHLSKEDHTTTFTSNIVYSHFPNDKILVNENQLSTVEVTAHGSGFTLLNYALFGPPTIEIDMSTAAISPSGNFLFSENKTKVSSFFSDKIDIVEILPNQLHFNFTSKGSRFIPVKANINFKYKDGFRPYGNPSISPAQVEVFGPQSVIDTIDYISTEVWSENQVSEAQELTLNLMVPHIEQLNLSLSEVSVSQDVDQFTEGEITLPIQLINLPVEKVDIHILPNEVTLKYIAAFRDFSEISKKDFKVEMDYESINSESLRAPLQIKVLKEKAQLLDWYPQTVDVILIR